ncbi:DUF1028 domain-containing protein [Salinirubrum litoreum]|uniref:DUF1028 domain-containing protein n=1 Tax=Salinirubrum litoreum TaxID=1126234 RepID=A0ABD5RFV0_9EURY|nr:DUF1028 domain-containing protein [Salinirubrum litoreum]
MTQRVPGTFSIAVRDRATNTYGAAVTTGTVAVGATCPYVSDSAAVVTQSYTNARYGREGVSRADDGESLETVLTDLVSEDEYDAYRQVHGVGATSDYAFTGDACVPWCGSRIGDDYTVAGNMLAGAEVLEATATAYETATGDVPDRLVSALEAGTAAGGDDRGELSAALLVAAPESRFSHNLRVDYSETPVSDLRGLLTAARGEGDRLQAGADDAFDGDYPPEILAFDVKY